MCLQLMVLTYMWVELSKEPNGEGPKTLLKAGGSWASDSPNSLLNSFKNPHNAGLRPKGEFSIPCQYTMIQWSDLMLLRE